MRKVLFLLLTIPWTGVVLQAQTPQALKKVMELKMPKTADDDMPGTRGAGVAWHPVQKKYYASFAGNVDYPMAVFDAMGKRLSDDELVTQVDTRGLWYNPVTKLLCGNAYNDGGWFTYTLETTDIPSGIEVVKQGMNQPAPQCQGVYNIASKQVMFLYLSQVYMYNNDGEPVDSMVIHWSRKKADGVAQDEDITLVPEDYNSTSFIYSGVKGQELVF
jgi:hypothetical protein